MDLGCDWTSTLDSRDSSVSSGIKTFIRYIQKQQQHALAWLSLQIKQQQNKQTKKPCLPRSSLHIISSHQNTRQRLSYPEGLPIRTLSSVQWFHSSVLQRRCPGQECYRCRQRGEMRSRNITHIYFYCVSDCRSAGHQSCLRRANTLKEFFFSFLATVSILSDMGAGWEWWKHPSLFPFWSGSPASCM